jgi:hypothetical protein
MAGMKRLKWLLVVIGCAVFVAMRPAGAQDTDHAFSGDMKPYTDTYNGFQIAIPVELEQQSKSAGGSWGPPSGSEGALHHMTVFVNSTDFHQHVNMLTVYQVNFKSNKENRDHTRTVPLKPCKWGKDTIYSFRTDEADHKAGQPEPKDPEDIHRTYLFVYGNGHAYEVMVAGQYQDFKSQNVRDIANKVFASFKPVAVK